MDFVNKKHLNNLISVLKLTLYRSNLQITFILLMQIDNLGSNQPLNGPKEIHHGKLQGPLISSFIIVFLGLFFI